MRKETDMLLVLRRCSDEPHALLLLASLSPAMEELIWWLATHIRGTERLEAYEWTPPRLGPCKWYVEVKDPAIPLSQPCEAPIRMRLWFTVSVPRGEIIWNGWPGTWDHGNCGTRDRRWHGLVRRRWPHLKAELDYHKYNFRP